MFIFSFKYHADNLTIKEIIKLPQRIKEGWGITHLTTKINETEITELFISDGSDEIFVLDLITWRIKRIIKVLLPTILMNIKKYLRLLMKWDTLSFG